MTVHGVVVFWREMLTQFSVSVLVQGSFLYVSAIAWVLCSGMECPCICVDLIARM